MLNINKKKLRQAIAEINAFRRGKPEEEFHKFEATRRWWNEPQSNYADFEAWQNAYRQWLDSDETKSWQAEYQRRYEGIRKFSAARATKLYSLMAHSRGKLHVAKRWEPTYLQDGSQKLVVKTLEDQEKFIADVIREFEYTPEECEEIVAKMLARQPVDTRRVPIPRRTDTGT